MKSICFGNEIIFCENYLKRINNKISIINNIPIHDMLILLTNVHLFCVYLIQKDNC